MRLMIKALAAAAYLGIGPASAQDNSMSFFVTSQGAGAGANLGGLEGADAHCDKLAKAANPGDAKTWRAYLSTSEANARDRIGAGPWYNAKGEKIADNVLALHSDANMIGKTSALDEKGATVNGRGDTPNRHDMLTGSDASGAAVAQTCENWTSDGEGSAMTGHHNRMGLDDSPPAKSWNSSHPSRGCGQAALQSTGGDGLFYCFAAE